jgi:hypothetical protein
MGARQLFEKYTARIKAGEYKSRDEVKSAFGKEREELLKSEDRQ